MNSSNHEMNVTRFINIKFKKWKLNNNYQKKKVFEWEKRNVLHIENIQKKNKH